MNDRNKNKNVIFAGVFVPCVSQFTMKKQIVFISCLILLLTGCQAYRDKQQIRLAESRIEHSFEQAKAELDRIEKINYLKLPLQWQARYVYLQCRIADELETGLPFASEVNTALRWYTKKGKTNEIIALSLFLGRAYMAEKDNQRAMDAFMDGLDRAEKTGLTNEAGYLSSYLADIYTQNNHIETALAKYEKAADYFLEAGNLRSYGFARRDMGFSYDMLELYPEALAAMHEADSIGKLLNDSLILSTVLNGFGNIYLSMGEYERAIHYILESLQTDDTSLHDQMVLSEAYIEAGQLTEARRILDTMSQDSIPEIFKRGIYYYYYMIYSKEGNDKEALYHFEQFFHLVEKRLNELEDHNYIEAEKKYHHQNLTVQVKELIIGEQRYFLLIGLLFLAVLILISLYLYRQMRTNRRLADQEKEINDNQREITRLAREVEKKKKEFAQAKGEMRKQKEEEIEQLKAGLAQIRENMILNSLSRKKLTNKLKNFNSAKGAWIEKELQSQMELEVDMVYPNLMLNLSNEYPALTETDLQYCVLSLYGFDPQQEAILLNIETGSVGTRRTRIGKKLQTSFKENNLPTFLRNYSLNL